VLKILGVKLKHLFFHSSTEKLVSPKDEIQGSWTLLVKNHYFDEVPIDDEKSYSAFQSDRLIFNRSPTSAYSNLDGSPENGLCSTKD